MNIAAILAANAATVKPMPYKIGESTLYVRRCNTHDRLEFLEEREKKEISKLWVVAFGLCNDKNERLYPDPDNGVEVLKDMFRSDVDKLEDMVMIELGFNIGDAAKKG